MRLLAILLFFGSAAAANAQFLSGNDLYPMCGRNTFAVSMFVAGSSSTGIIEALNLGHVRKVISDPKFKSPENTAKLDLLDDITKMIRPYCLPRNATIAQAGDVVCKYLREKPARRTDPAGLIVKMALGEAWPCEPNGPVE